uniref:AAA family ATPase n=1 Tax=Bartonella sp. MU70NMGDW TaxID=3243561 RepID=UPI0035D0DCED
MSLPIISADERLKETKGIKGCIFGKSGIGKTSLLWTLPAEKTLFFDLEAGDFAKLVGNPELLGQALDYVKDPQV